MSDTSLLQSEISTLQRQATQFLLAEQPGKVVALLAPVIDRAPDCVALLNPYGVALMRVGRFAEAATVFTQSLTALPHQHLPAYNRGICQQQTGKTEAAMESFRYAVAQKPDFLQALNMAAIMQAKLGRIHDAIASYDAAIRRAPQQALLYGNRGGLHLSQGQTQLALQDFDHALKIDPNAADYWRNKGLAHAALEQHTEALAAYDRATALEPNTPQNHLQRGIALLALDRTDVALTAFNRAIELKPDYAPAWQQRGVLYRKAKQPEKAITDFKRAIAMDPQNPEGFNLLANVLAQEARFTEALPHYDRAIALKPDFSWAYNNRGNAHKELGHIAEAEADFNRAMELDAKTPVFRWNKSLLTLLQGDFARGWVMFESRWERNIIRTAQENQLYPRWDGTQDISGKTILLHAEQGLGDTIQFCRYAPMVAKLGAHVLLSVQPALMEMCKTLQGKLTITTRGQAHGTPDYQCPLMSLPGVFHTDLSSIPADIPYLHPSADKVAAWQTRLGEKSRPRIGLVWSGNAGLLPDKSRSIPADVFRALTELPFEFHLLQKEVRETDMEALGSMQIRRHEAELEDFSDTAALIENLDLVISVDTSVAHMAGAIGKPLWLITPLAPDWRWLLERTDSPWYPTARLFRQRQKGNWTEVLQDIAAALAQYF